MVWIVMGVSGSGKTTIGRILAENQGLPFYDADDFHPPQNVEKMRSGQPLNDHDRKPWLDTLSRHISDWNRRGGAVLACSALKKSYRNTLRSDGNHVQFIYLKGSKEMILKRMNDREDHYMPPSLLDSQFEALEEPPDAITVFIDNPPEKIIAEILNEFTSENN